jgi:hypothetical protein
VVADTESGLATVTALLRVSGCGRRDRTQALLGRDRALGCGLLRCKSEPAKEAPAEADLQRWAEWPKKEAG